MLEGQKQAGLGGLTGQPASVFGPQTSAAHKEKRPVVEYQLGVL